MLNRTGSFWIYADSTGHKFFVDIRNATFCHDVYQNCNDTQNKFYMQKYLSGSKEMDGKDFEIGRLLRELEEILTDPMLNDTNSVLMINYDLHYSMGISFQTFISMMDQIVELLNTYKQTIPAEIIWRTTSAINKWKDGFGRKHDDVTTICVDLIEVFFHFKHVVSSLVSPQTEKKIETMFSTKSCLFHSHALNRV